MYKLSSWGSAQVPFDLDPAEPISSPKGVLIYQANVKIQAKPQSQQQQHEGRQCQGKALRQQG